MSKKTKTLTIVGSYLTTTTKACKRVQARSKDERWGEGEGEGQVVGMGQTRSGLGSRGHRQRGRRDSTRRRNATE